MCLNRNHNRSPSATQIGGVIQSTAALKDRSNQHPSVSGGAGGGVGVGGSGNAVSCSFLGNSGSSGMGLSTGSAGGNGYYNMMSSCSTGSGSVDGSNSINRPLGGHGGGALNPASNMGEPSEFAAMIPGGLHIKDAKQINNEAGKNGRDNVSLISLRDPNLRLCYLIYFLDAIQKGVNRLSERNSDASYASQRSNLGVA